MHAILCIYIIYTCIWCYVFVHTDLHSTLLFVFVWLHLIEGQFSVINLSQTVSLTHCAMISLPKHMLNIPISCMCCPPQAFILLQRGCFYFCRCFLWDPHGLLFTRKKQDALEAGLAPKMQMEAEDLSFKSQLCRFHYWIYLVGLVYVEVFKCFRCGGGQPLTISVASRHGPMGMELEVEKLLVFSVSPNICFKNIQKARWQWQWPCEPSTLACPREMCFCAGPLHGWLSSCHCLRNKAEYLCRSEAVARW